MARLVGICAAVLMMLSLGSRADAATIVVDFDDLTGTGLVADGYAGITWGGVWVYYDQPQDPYTPSSGATRIYNDPRQSDQPFKFSSPVVFNGGYFAGTDFPEVGFDLYNSGSLVWSSARTSISNIPLFLASGYDGLVDEVRVYSSQGDFYVLDDITYSTAAPEPATLLLMGSGLLGAGARRWRRSRA